MTIVGVNRITLTKTADGWLKSIEVDVFGREVNNMNSVHQESESGQSGAARCNSYSSCDD